MTDDDDWLFAPERFIWRTSRERAILVAGPAAAVLQVAHPSVALGVAEHSDFSRDAIGRLNRTMHVVNAIVFGKRGDLARIRERMIKMHGRIQGGGYHALDPELLLWVLTTLCMAGIAGYEWLSGEPVTEAQREEYFTDIRIFGEAFGLDREFGPQDFGEFAAYYQAMLAGDLLGSQAVCAEQARHVIFPSSPRWAGVLGRASAGLSTHFIPEPVRSRLGLGHLPWSAEAVERAARVTRAILPVLPARLRYMPEYLRARAAD